MLCTKTCQSIKVVDDIFTKYELKRGLYFFWKLALRLLAKIAAMARFTSPLLFLSSWIQASRGKPIAIMLPTSASFTSPAGADEGGVAAAAGAGPGVAPLLDSLVSMLLSEADLTKYSIVS